MDTPDKDLKKTLLATSNLPGLGMNMPINSVTSQQTPREGINLDNSQRYLYKQDPRQQSIANSKIVKGGTNTGYKKKNFSNLMKVIELKSPFDNNASGGHEASQKCHQSSKKDTSCLDHRGVSEAENVASCFDTGRAIIIVRQTHTKSPVEEKRALKQTVGEETMERCVAMQMKTTSGTVGDSATYKTEKGEEDIFNTYKKNQSDRRSDNNVDHVDLEKVYSGNLMNLFKDYESGKDGNMKQNRRVLLRKVGQSSAEPMITNSGKMEQEKTSLKICVEEGGLARRLEINPLIPSGGKQKGNSSSNCGKGGVKVWHAGDDIYEKKSFGSSHQLHGVENVGHHCVLAPNSAKISGNDRYLEMHSTELVDHSRNRVKNVAESIVGAHVLENQKNEVLLQQNQIETKSEYNERPVKPTECLKEGKHIRQSNKLESCVKNAHYDKTCLHANRICQHSEVTNDNEPQETRDPCSRATKSPGSEAISSYIISAQQDQTISESYEQDYNIYSSPSKISRLRNETAFDKKSNLHLAERDNSKTEPDKGIISEELVINTRSNRPHNLVHVEANGTRYSTRTSKAKHAIANKYSGVLGKRRETSS